MRHPASLNSRLLSLRRFEYQSVDPAQSGHELFVWPITDIHEAEVVILTVGAPALWMIVELEPVQSDHVRLSGERLRSGRGSYRTRLLRCYGHEMTRLVDVVAGRRLLRPALLGYPVRLRFPVRFSCAAKNHSVTSTGFGASWRSPSKIVSSDPAVRSVRVVVRRDDIDILTHDPDGVGIVIDRETVTKIQRLGISGQNGFAHDPVIVFRDNARPISNDREPLPAGPNPRRGPGLSKQIVETSTVLGRCEVTLERLPILAIPLSEATQSDVAWCGCSAHSVCTR